MSHLSPRGTGRTGAETAASLAREHGLAVIGYLQKPVTADAFRSLLAQMVAMVPESAFDRGHQ